MNQFTDLEGSKRVPSGQHVVQLPHPHGGRGRGEQQLEELRLPAEDGQLQRGHPDADGLHGGRQIEALVLPVHLAPLRHDLEGELEVQRLRDAVLAEELVHLVAVAVADGLAQLERRLVAGIFSTAFAILDEPQQSLPLGS